ncbi:MAG: hypothetical protein HMLKMBBP_02500 [Planctomycetes bacterium]|nr:hypothetical protein [Planctomycetota bacterium]
MTSPLPAARRTYAVVGMHRSGTSWLAGSLQEKGLELGEVSTRDPHNQKGNRESAVLMEIHEGVLHDNGGSWKRPVFPCRWTPERSAALSAHCAAMDAAYPAWGFKDPRSLFMLDAWRRLRGALVCVGIYRHPLAVAKSLAARSERFDEDRSVKLWCAYNERLVDELAARPFPLLRFDVPPDALLPALEAASREIGFAAAAKDSGFFSKDLVHHGGSDLAVPKAARKLWDELERSAIRA